MVEQLPALRSANPTPLMAFSRLLNGGRRAIDPGDGEAFASHKPNVGARPATNLQQAHLLAIGNAVEISGNKAHYMFGRILAPFPAAENLLPHGIPTLSFHDY